MKFLDDNFEVFTGRELEKRSGIHRDNQTRYRRQLLEEGYLAENLGTHKNCYGNPKALTEYKSLLARGPGED
jgi:hypothetical protein